MCTYCAYDLAIDEGRCPAKVTQDGAMLTRTVAARDPAQKVLWNSFRGISNLTDGKINVRVWTTWYTGGILLP